VVLRGPELLADCTDVEEGGLAGIAFVIIGATEAPPSSFAGGVEGSADIESNTGDDCSSFAAVEGDESLKFLSIASGDDSVVAFSSFGRSSTLSAAMASLAENISDRMQKGGKEMSDVSNHRQHESSTDAAGNGYLQQAKRRPKGIKDLRALSCLDNPPSPRRFRVCFAPDQFSCYSHQATKYRGK
jgi:hypothetical protein